MLNIFSIIGIILIILLNIFLILCFREYMVKFQGNNYLNKIHSIESSLSKIQNEISNNFSLTEKNLREELRGQILSLTEIINSRLNEINVNLNSSINSLRNQSNIDSKLNRDELSSSFEYS